MKHGSASWTRYSPAYTEPGESHFELLRAFASDAVLDQTHAALLEHGYRTHEFGDSMLIERQCARQKRECENSRYYLQL